MYAVVVRESGDPEQIEASADIVERTVAPQVRSAPGFVGALWMSDGAGSTLNVITFQSESAAMAALEAARTAPRPPFMRVDRVDLLRVLASA
jgi:hypothetical protein